MRLGYDGDLGLGGCNRLYGIGALEMLRFCSSDLIIVCGFGVCPGFMLPADMNPNSRD